MRRGDGTQHTMTDSAAILAEQRAVRDDDLGQVPGVKRGTRLDARRTSLVSGAGRDRWLEPGGEGVRAGHAPRPHSACQRIWAQSSGTSSAGASA